MKDSSKTKQELIEELFILNRKIKKLEKSESKRKQAEDEIQDTLEYAENIVETVREPLIVLTSDLKILSANRSFYDTFKVMPEETIGNFIYDLGNRQWDIPKLRVLFEDILPHDTVFNGYEVEHDFLNIGHKVIMLNARQIFRKNIGSHIILLAMEDITEHKRLENLLIESEERFRRLFETTNDGIVLLEKREGKIAHTNPAAEKMFGYTKEECIGKKLQDIGVLLDRGDFQATMQILNTNGIINYNDVPVKTKYGQHIDTDIYLVDRAELVQCNIRDITAHKKAEKDVLRQRNLSQKYLQIAGVMMAVLNSVGEIILINKKGLDILGYKDERELLGKNWFDVGLPKKIVAEVKQVFSQLISGNIQPVEYYENTVLTKSGEERIVAFHNAVLRDKKDKISGILFSGEDITERKQAEEELRESENFLKTLLNSIPIPVFYKDRDGRYLGFNKAFETFFGATKAKIIGKTVFDINPPDLAAIYHVQDNELFASGGTQQYLSQVKNALGSMRDVIFNKAVFTNRQSVIVGQIGAIQDITDSKRAEEIVHKSEEKFNKAFHSSPILTAISTVEDGRFIDVNEIFLSTLLFSREEVIGKTSLELGLFANFAQRQAIKEINEEKGYAKNIELQMLAKNGQIIDGLFSAEPITINNEKCWITVMIDVTEQKRAEAALRESEEKHRVILEESSDPIFSFTPEGQYKYANKAFAKGVGKSIEDIIGKKIWDVFPKEEADKRFAALSQVFRTGEQKTIEVRVPLADGDRYYITTITPVKDTIGKLVSAICSSKDITDRKRAEVEQRLSEVRLSGYDNIREGDYVVLSVSDEGEGISESDLKRIFEPFYTKKIMGRSGTGLGLAVVWGTVKDHQGYIDVQSEEGKGTIFTLYFPVSREDITKETPSVSLSEYLGNGESVLVVDDVKKQRDLAARMLQSLNYNVSSVSSGEDAIEYLREHKVDLIVLDMIMDPGMDGLETYKKIIEIHPRQKAIIVSGFSESDRVNAAHDLGAGAYVKKPYVIEKLGLAVKKELDRAT